MYLKVVKDIIEYYSNILNKEELLNLNNIVNKIKDIKDEEIEDNIIIFINSILDKVWKSTLTNFSDYKSGEEFCFLVKPIDLVIDEVNKTLYDYNDSNNEKFCLLTNNNIKDYGITSFGYIVNINYKGSIKTEPLLPIYFDKKFKELKKLNYNLLAVCFLDSLLNDRDYNSLYVEKTCEKKDLPLILLDKRLYKDKKSRQLLSKDDLEEIAQILSIRFCETMPYDMLKFLPYKYNFTKNNLVYSILLKYYNNKISIEELEKILFEKFEEIVKEIEKQSESLDNKNKRVI